MFQTSKFYLVFHLRESEKKGMAYLCTVRFLIDNFQRKWPEPTDITEY